MLYILYKIYLQKLVFCIAVVSDTFLKTNFHWWHRDTIDLICCINVLLYTLIISENVTIESVGFSIDGHIVISNQVFFLFKYVTKSIVFSYDSLKQ